MVVGPAQAPEGELAQVPIERFWWLLVTDPKGNLEVYGPTSVIYRIHARHCGVVRELKESGEIKDLNKFEFVLLWLSRKQIKKEFPHVKPKEMEPYK